MGSGGGIFGIFRKIGLWGGFFGGIFCVATRNLLLKRFAFRGIGQEGYFGVLCVATGNLLLKRLAIWVLGILGSGGGNFGVSKIGFGERILGKFCV